MPDTIRDGTGGGNLAKVDDDNRVHTLSITEGVDRDANFRGEAYNLNTGTITLTNATETPVAYLKNNEAKDLVIDAIAVGVDDSTGGDATFTYIKVIRNPTAGTIVSSPTTADINSNRNYGSSKSLTVDWYKGATGDTMTDGEDHIIFGHNAGNRLFASIEEILPRGSTLGVKITPPPNNTSMTIYVALICHLQEA